MQLKASEARLEMSLRALSAEIAEAKAASGNQNQSINLALSSQRIFFAVFVAVAAYVGFQSNTLISYQRLIRTEFQQLLADERKSAEKTLQLFPWELRIRSAVDNLKFGEKWQREKAIYDILQPALRSNKYEPHFRSIARLYADVVPELGLRIQPAEYSDLYRSKLWICFDLLTSGDRELAMSVHRALPEDRDLELMKRSEKREETREELSDLLGRISAARERLLGRVDSVR